MILCDVNLLVNACSPGSPDHRRHLKVLEGLLGSETHFGIHGPILAAVLRICTNARIFRPPSSSESIFAFLEALRAHPRAVEVVPGPRHWPIFRDLVSQLRIRGGDVTDAWFAALALENDCEWWTADAGFLRFPGLRVRILGKEGG